LGELRVEKTLRVLEKTDLAVLLIEVGQTPDEWENKLVDMASERQIPLIIVESKSDFVPRANIGTPTPAEIWARKQSLPFVRVSSTTGENIETLKQELIANAPAGFCEPTIIGDLINPGDIVILVVPIDSAAPKGRLILPQVMTLRDILDHNAYAVVAKESELKTALESLSCKPKIVVTDSQAFRRVAEDTPPDIWMTSFSILMARYKGDLVEFVKGARALRSLKPGDRVLISEGCTHHRQKDDIGTVQIPKYLATKVGGELNFRFSSGIEFPSDIQDYKVIIHCGGCTLNRREMCFRQKKAREAGVPMTNYGVTLAYIHGILDRALAPFPEAKTAWDSLD
ncbi:MAG: [FeFe] hydrogenase H-cluster maturation GTPase HydF, partial [Armatimonadota bacterium]|nr:[FeFe] hydrogenase H-cluster maturation GTPase HydF [Armatimonadota bacterium]